MTTPEIHKKTFAVFLAVAAAMMLTAVPLKSAITAVSNSPDPFDNQVAGQTSYVQSTPDSGTTAFPNRGEWIGNNYYDLTLDLFDSSGTFVRRLWSNYLNAWPARPNGNLPPDFDGRGQFNSSTLVRGTPLAYGTYTAKLTQGITETFSTKVPTLYLMGRPTDIFVSSDGTVYVLNDATKKVLRYSSDGTLLLSGFDVTLNNPNNELQGLVLDSSGNIYIAEHDQATDLSRVQKYSSTGTLVNACFIPWDVLDSGGNRICSSSVTQTIQIADGMAIDSSNNIFVSDAKAKTVYEFLAAGTVKTVGTSSNGWTVREVTVDPSDNNLIYFVHAKDGTPNANNLVTCRKYASGAWGACTNPWNTTLTLTSDCDPLGVAADSSYLYVSCACDSATYVYGGTDVNCADNIHTVYSYNKSTKVTVATFGSTPPGSANNKFNVPHGLAVNTAGTYLYVAESGNNRVKKLSLSSGAMTFASHIYDEYSTPYPTSIDMDADGNVYVALSSSGLIKKFNADGDLICTIGGFGTGSGLFQNLYGLGVSDDGTYIWASDVNDDSVDRFIVTNKDTCAGSWTIIDMPAPGNINAGPRGIVVEPGVAGSSAHAYVLHDQNKKIYKYAAAGGTPDNFSNLSADPRYITMDKQGFLYVVYENGSIDKLSNTGTVIQSFANTSTYVTAGGGIAVDDYGNVYVSDRGDYTADPPTKGMTIHRFGNYVDYKQTDGTGAAHKLIWQGHFRGVCDPRLATCSPPGTGDGQLNSPWGVAVSNDGRYVWVSDYGNNKLQKFNIGYLTTVTDQVTIGNASAPPNVSTVSVSPVSPVPAGRMQAVVSYNKSMTPYETPSVQVITQNNCQLPIYDEAVITDNNSNGLFESLTDTKLIGVTPPEGTALVTFRSSNPKEGFIDFPLTGGGDSSWSANAGEPIVADGTTSTNQVFNVGADTVLYATQTTPSGIPTDLNSKSFILFPATTKHTDNGPTIGYYDGFYVTNEWRGWITIPSGNTACCGGSCDGTAQIQVANGKDAAGTIENPNPWNTNTSTGYQFIIDTTQPTEPTITSPSDMSYTTQNSVAVTGSYNDANGYQVTVSSTDFACVVREAVTSLNNTYNSGVDTLIYGSCADGTALLSMTAKEGWIDLNSNGQYDNNEPIIGNYYDISSTDPRYDQGTEPCTNCDRVLLDLGTYSNLAVVKLFSTYDSRIRVNRISTQTVDSTGSFTANNIELPTLSTFYVTAIALDRAGNYSPYVAKRVKITRGQGNPGVAGITPYTSVGISTAGQWTVTYTAATQYDYPADSGNCSCGATPSTTANCYITMTVPSGWAPPTKTANTSGTVSVSATGDTVLCAAETFSVSGQTVRVAIDKMNAGQSISIVYGYPSSGVDVTDQAALGGNTFGVSAKNYGDSSPVTVPPETGKTLSIVVEGMALRVSHTGYLPGTIYDNQTNIKVMTLNFENPNTVGSGKVDQVSAVKLKFIPSGSQTAAGTISRIVAKSGATEYLNTTNISSITDGYNVITLTLSDADSDPLTIPESSVKSIDIYMDFQQVSTLYPVGSTLEFLLDGDYDTTTGTSTGLTSTVLTNSGASWTTNQWVSHTLIPDLNVPTKSYRIKANSSTTLTIRSGDMLTDGAVSGHTYAIGDGSDYVTAKDQTTGTALHVSPRTGSVQDTFYPDYPTANSQMSSGKTTQFKAPPIANGLLVVKRDTWAIGQVLSKGQTSTKPIVLTMRLFDQIVTSTDAGTNCAPTCSTVFVGDTSVFTGMEGQTVIIGDDDNYTTATIAPGGVDPVGKSISFTMSVGPYYVNKNMFILRDGASAKVARIVFSFYECNTTGCTPTTATTNPRGLLDRVALRQTSSDPAFFYVNKEDSSIETSGSTVQLDFSTYLQLSGAEKKSMDVLLDMDSNTTATSMKMSLLDASMVYPNSRKTLTNNCTACSRVYINNAITNDIIQNERIFISTNGSAGEWSAVSGENTSYVDVSPAYTGSYTTTSFVEHSKVQTGYESTALQNFPLNSLSVSIVNSSQIRINKMYVRDTNDAALCPNTEAGTGTDNPELYYGTSFKVVLEVENISTAPSSMAYVDATASDLSFIRLSDLTDYRGEFVVTPPAILGGTCMHQACLTTGATAALVYTVTQSGGTTVAPTSSSNYFKIDTYQTAMIGAPDCDTSKAGRYRPKSVDSNDYTDTDIYCINPDSNGVDTDPPNCRLSTKTAEAYVLTDPVQLKYVGAGSTFVPIMNFMVYDGPSGNAGQVVTEMSFQSQNSSDTYVGAVQLWRDDGDSAFDPYVDGGTAKQVLADDCTSCTVLKVNDANRYAVGQNVTVCHNSTCSASSARTVSAVDKTASPNTITLSTALAVTISQKTDKGYVYINNGQVCGAGGSNCDTLVGTTTFSGGVATFTGLSEGIPDTSYKRYFLSYNINTTLDTSSTNADGATIDAAIKSGGIKFQDNPSAVAAIPSANLGSSGTSKIDLVAVMILADPPSSQSCIQGQRIITFKSEDIYENLDNGSYGNPVTYANSNVTVTFTESKNTGASADTVDFVSSSLSGATFSPANPPGDADEVKGNLTNGVGTITLTDVETAPPENVTINLSSSLTYKPAGGAVTTFGNNVCISAVDIAGLEPPAGQTKVPVLTLQVINGLASAITVTSFKVNKATADTLTSSELLSIKLWRDGGTAGTCDVCYPTLGSGDTQLASGNYTSGTVTLSPAATISSGEKTYFYVTYDLNTTVTDGHVMDAELPVNGFTYNDGTSHSLDTTNTSNSPGTSRVNIAANSLEIYPYASTATVTVDCNEGSGVGVNCRTFNISDVAIFAAGDKVSIQDNDSGVITPLLTVQSVNPSGAIVPTVGTITFTTPATGTFTVAQEAFVSNTPEVSKLVTVRAVDTYGNIASYPANETFEASTQASVTADTTQPDPSDTQVIATSLTGGTLGGPSTSGLMSYGTGTVTFIENSCPPRRVLISPGTSAAGFTTFKASTIRFPGNINKDNVKPVASEIKLDVTGSCITQSTPKISSIKGSDDCSGIAGMRFACSEAQLATAAWVPISPSQIDLDVCCNCTGDSRDIKCGFDITNGKTCLNWDGTTCISGWVSNTGDPNGGCADSAAKTVYLQVKDRNGNLSVLPTVYTSPPVVIDTTLPVITAVNVYSNQELYFYGSSDNAGMCDANPQSQTKTGLNADCTVYFNSLSGLGAGQVPTVQLTATDNNSITALEGDSAFGLAAQWDYASPAGTPKTLSVSYNNIAVGAASTTVYFTDYDTCSNTIRVRVDFGQDNEAPSTPAMSGYPTSAKATTLTSGNWYNYTNPYFEWAAATDLPSGAASGIKNYMYEFSTDSGASPLYATTATNFTATGPLTSGDIYYVRFAVYDNVGNYTNPASTTFTYKYDSDAPTTVFVGPAASSWQKADFTVDVTNADTGGSGLSVCYYRVLSNSVETVGWTSYTCTSDPTVTVGASANCLDEGADKCQVEFYNTDVAGNTGTTQTRTFSIDYTGPSVTFNNPAASAWKNASFDVDISDSDATSGLATCEYMVESDNGSWTETKAWTARTCNSATSANITVGAAAYCLDQGADKCRVTVRATDNAGNVTTLAGRTFGIDYTGPSVTFNNPAASSWQKTAFDIDISDSDATSGLATCEYMVESDNGSWTETKAWTARTCNSATSANITVGAAAYCLDQGADKCRVTVRATDNAGNVTTLAGRTFSIDYTGPSVTFNNPAASAWKNAAFDIDVSDSDTGSGLATCEYMVESDNGSWTETKAWAARTCNSATSANITVGAAAYCLDQGADKCRVTVRATDNAGNVTTLAGRTFSIDYTPPSVTFNNPAASAWKSTAFDVDISDSDATSGLATCEYMVESDNGSWTETKAWASRTCNSATSANITVGAAAFCLDEGADKCRVTVRATDNAGNVTTLAGRTFSIDYTAPTVTFTSPAASSWQKAAFDISIADSDATSGLATCEYMVESDNGSWTETKAWAARTCNSATSANITVGAAAFCLDEGADKCRVTVKATDNAGNVTTLAGRTFSIDYTAPTVTFNNPAASAWKNAAFDVDISDSDAGSGLATCEYMVESNNGSWVEKQAWTARTCNSATSANITVGAAALCLDEGADKCRVTVRATDNAGNVTTLAGRTFSIDYTAPTVTFTSPAASSWQKAAFDISIADSDATSGLATCEYMVESDNGSWTETKAWASRTCNSATSANITVGAAAFCLDEGADKCRVTVKATDNAGNVTTLAGRTFSIDYTGPSVTFNNPAPSAWEGVSFNIDISDSDAGSGLTTCEYMVESNNGSWTETKAWAARTCNSATSAGITSGAAADCRDQGTDKCRITVRATDNAGNVTTLAGRTFSIDYTPPTTAINSPAASAWKNADFVVDVTNADTGGSGLASCYYRVLSNSVETAGWVTYDCATDPTLTVGAAANCRDEGTDMCQAEFYNTDGAGNTGTTVTRTFSIDWTPPDIGSIDVLGYKTSAKLIPIDNDELLWYKYTTPYFEWADVSDLPVAPSSSGIKQYYIYFGTNASTNPTTTQAAAGTNTYTAPVPVGTEFPTHYYMIIKAEDNAGNVSATTTAFFYNYDRFAPEPPTNVKIHISASDPTVLTKATWYNYSTPYFDWTPSVDSGAGTRGYYVVMATDPVYFSTAAANFTTSAYYDVAASGPVLISGSQYKIYMKTVDFVRNDANYSNLFVLTDSEYWYDRIAPTVTINSPAASAWKKASFVVDVTNADTGGSGLATCYLRVLSNSVETVTTTYDCATDPTLTIGAAAYCRDQGADMCQAEFYDFDVAGNKSATATRTFSIDWVPPTTTINNPAAGTWQRANFQIDVTNTDSGSGLAHCYYRVLSNSVQTLYWFEYTCTAYPTITVGFGSDCRDEGVNMCQVEMYATDNSGNTGAPVTRQYSIDFTPPTTSINSPAASSWQRADFAVDVTNADTGGSGLSNCYYRVLSNSVETAGWGAYACATDPTLTVGAAANCRDQGVDMCQVELYATDGAGNTGTTQTRLFSIDFTPPTTVINSPAASSWQRADFVVDVTNADTGGSGLSICYYRVLSNSVETLAWTTYTCTADPTLTVGAAANCRDDGTDICQVEFYNTDVAGNTGTTVTRVFSIDRTPPTVTINSPAASAWKNADFVVDVTNADNVGGSGLANCYYRVLSNSVETAGWATYTCTTDPTLTVGAAANCRDDGADMCQVEFYNTDVAGNTGTTVTRLFSIDRTPPTTVINSPAASSWQRADFVVDVTNADTGGSGLDSCYYRVLSNSVETLTWTTYTCTTDPTLTVGAAANCRDDGADMCQVEFYNTDVAGNTGTTVTRLFSIDRTPPTTVINSPAASSWQRADFVVDVTNADTGGSGLDSCYYRVLSNSVETAGWATYTCTTDPTLTVGAAANCRDDGADMCQVEFYNTDVAGNTGTTVTRLFSIDRTPPTTVINSPAASAWKSADFVVDVTNADTGGSGLANCYYRVLSNSVETAGWATYTCTTDPTLTVGAAANCRDDGADMCQVEFYNTDVAGNTGTTVTRLFSIDRTPPTVTINSPAASAWKNADFVVDVTNADTGGSGLANCYYRVLSNSVETLAWTTYTCTADPTLTVGAAADCRDDGVDMCQIELYDTDVAGNTGTTVTRVFSIDRTPPTTVINSPAASSWQRADFVVDVTNADTGGSGLANCYYRVLSNSVETAGWATYTCTADPTLTVGAAADCRDDGADMCQVEFYNTDVAGNTGTTVTRTFSIDRTPPTTVINSPVSGAWKSADFVADVTNADNVGGSGLASCYYHVLSNSVETHPWGTYTCSNDPAITVGAGDDCRDQGTDICTIEFYAIDVAGNTGNTASSTISIDWTPPTVAINSPAASTWEGADFVVDVTNADVGVGLDQCYYRIVSNSVETLAWTSYACATDPTATVGASAYCDYEDTDACSAEFYNTDLAGNLSATATRLFSIDWEAPDNPATVNGWADNTKATAISDGGSYEGLHPYFEWATPNDNPVAPANSGLDGYYVYFGTDPNGVPTAFQTAATYTASTVDCNQWHYLRIRTRDKSNPNNISAAVTIFTYFKIGDVTITDNQADDDTWRNAAGTLYDVDFTTTCEDLDYAQYAIWTAADMSAGTGTQMVPWTTFAGPGLNLQTYTDDWSIAPADFANAAEGINWVSVRVSCVTGLTNYATDVFYFRKDTIAPVIGSAAFSESNDYTWISPSDGKLYYGLGMAAPQTITVSGTASDATSGLLKATFSNAFSDAPADDNTPATWLGDYTIEASDTVAPTITVTLYDNAGNTSTAQMATVQNNNLVIEYATMTPPLVPTFPTFVKFNVYYPDGVTPMMTGDPDGLYATTSVGVDASHFIQGYDGDGNPVGVYDDAADAGAEDFVVQMLRYQTGALDTCGGLVSGTNAWCLELLTGECVSSKSPHYVGLSATNVRTSGFYANFSEKTIDGDLGGALTPPVADGDAGTFLAHTGPDYMKVFTDGDGLITEDMQISAWTSCGSYYCSNVPTVTAKPDFVKRDTGSGPVQLTEAAYPPAAGQWAWDSGSIVLADDPSAVTITATLNGQSEKVCVELVDACDQRIINGRWHDDTVSLTLSQAPDSGMTISRNDASGANGFDSVTVPVAGFADPDTIEVKGNLRNGLACMTLTAESVPSDDPRSPIKITPAYFGAATLGHSGGVDIPAFVLIRESTGVSSGTTSLSGITQVSNVFIPTPTTATQSIVLAPAWSADGARLAFVSRQTSPCDGDAATGDTPYSDFAVYTLDQSAGSLDGCRRLTRNGTDFMEDYGVAPYSEVTWSQSSDRVIFAAPDMIGSGQSKLFWVSATGTVGSATGSQYNYPPAGPVLSTESVWDDVTAGTSSINVSLAPFTEITAGKEVVIYETDPITNEVLSREIKTVTAVGHDYGNSITTFSFSLPLVNSYTGMNSGGSSYVEYPVTLRQLGQNLVSLEDSTSWFDPNMSGNYAECDASYRNKLLAVRAPSDISEDTVCDPACSTDGYSAMNANIIMIDGGTDSDGLYKVDGSTSNVSRITAFSGNAVWPLKPKWSPDCKMIAFLSWDRTPDVDFPTAPSKTSVYVINIDSDAAGFVKATLPITSLSDPGVYKIYDYASYTMSANVPNWSADGKLVSYSIDRTNSLDLSTINSGMSNIVEQLFSGSNYDTYLEYIPDQPESQGAVFSPQIVGQVQYNELNMTQCPSNAASTCPNKPNTPYVQVAQLNSADGAYLRMLTLGNESTVTSNGGILFEDGIVTAVFPPNVIASDTVFFNTDPTAYCGGAGLPDCPVDPTTEYIVQAGDAREFFPDGTNFQSYVRLIFHYCDNDNDGKVDAGTESIETATSGGTKAYTFDPITNACYIDGAPTSGGSIDVDTLAVYNWNSAASSWDRMDGSVDKTTKTITVYSTHFSRYDTLGFRMGFAPSSLTPLQLLDVHTYPNPYVASANAANGVKFAASDVIAGAGENVTLEIKVYDIRGSLVTTLVSTINEGDAHENNGHTLYTWRPVVNAGGRTLASGVYVYYLTARTANYEATFKGKFSVVR